MLVLDFPGRHLMGSKKVCFLKLLVKFFLRLRCLPFFVLSTPPKQKLHFCNRAILKNVSSDSRLRLQIAWLYLSIYDTPLTQKRHSWKHWKCSYFEILKPGAQDALVNLYNTPKQKLYFGFRGLCGNSECLIWGRLWIHSLFGRVP